MKLLTYKINSLKSSQIGVLEDQSVYNLNAFFGDISLVELVQIDDYQNKIASFISNKNCKKHDLIVSLFFLQYLSLTHLEMLMRLDST